MKCRLNGTAHNIANESNRASPGDGDALRHFGWRAFAACRRHCSVGANIGWAYELAERRAKLTYGERGQHQCSVDVAPIKHSKRWQEVLIKLSIC